MTDLSTLQAGDRVKLRCGSELIVSSSRLTMDRDFLIEFETFSESNWIYNSDGSWDFSHTTPFDIIEIIKKPFDWSQIKEGREYIIFGNYAEYIGWSDTLKRRVFYLKGDCSFAAFEETQNIKISDRGQP